MWVCVCARARAFLFHFVFSSFRFSRTRRLQDVSIVSNELYAMQLEMHSFCWQSDKRYRWQRLCCRLSILNVKWLAEKLRCLGDDCMTKLEVKWIECIERAKRIEKNGKHSFCRFFDPFFSSNSCWCVHAHHYSDHLNIVFRQFLCQKERNFWVWNGKKVFRIQSETFFVYKWHWRSLWISKCIIFCLWPTMGKQLHRFICTQ